MPVQTTNRIAHSIPNFCANDAICVQLINANSPTNAIANEDTYNKSTDPSSHS